MSLKETPLLYTDLLSPNSLAKNHDPFELSNDVIPIKTWTSGSPLKNKGKFTKDDLSGLLGDGTMESYFAKAFGDPTDEEGETEEGEDENAENYEEEEENENYQDEGETQQYGEDTDFDEYEDENEEEYEGDEGDEEEEYQQDEEGQYDQALEEETAKGPLYSDLLGLIDTYEEMKEEVLRESGSNLSFHQNRKSRNSSRGVSGQEAEEQNVGEESEDTATSIMNEYKDLLSYIKTPRRGNEERGAEDDDDMMFNPDFDQLFPKQPKNKSNIKKEEPSLRKKSLVKKVPVSDVMVDKGNSIVHFGSKSNDEDDGGYYIQKEENTKKSKKNKLKKQQHKKIPELLPLNKKSHPLLRNKAPTKDDTEKQAKMTQAHRKHKQMLALLVSKRKEEEEELLALAAKAEERRKKFKQALLEKALSRKEEEPISPPPVVESKAKATASVNVPSHSGRHHPPVNRKTPSEVVTDSEEAVKEQEEKREHVAGIRRKFKEQHKNLLLSLMLKKKEEELLVRVQCFLFSSVFY
jgi:hypothetical protein